jgi:hypothetical protein
MRLDSWPGHNVLTLPCAQIFFVIGRRLCNPRHLRACLELCALDRSGSALQLTVGADVAFPSNFERVRWARQQATHIGI